MVVINGDVKINFGPLPMEDDDEDDAGDSVETLAFQKAGDMTRLVGIVGKTPRGLNFRQAIYGSLTFISHCWQESRERLMCDTTLKKHALGSQ